MSQAMHTPWSFRPQIGDWWQDKPAQIIADGKVIATLAMTKQSDEANARARLIAAAPEMLEALQEITMAVSPAAQLAAEAKAHAAIAKATEQ